MINAFRLINAEDNNPCLCFSSFFQVKRLDFCAFTEHLD